MAQGLLRGKLKKSSKNRHLVVSSKIVPHSFQRPKRDVMIMGRVRVKAKVQMTQTKHEPSKWGLWGSNVRLPALNLTLTLLTLTLTLPTIPLALFSQTFLYWLDCLTLALRHWNHSFDFTSANPNLDPPHSNLGPLQSNLILLVGLSHACFETLEPQLWLYQRSL